MMNNLDGITPENVAFYARVSTEAQADGTSVDNQIANGQQWAKETFGFKVPHHNIYREEGASGASLDRPVLQQLVRAIQSGRYRVIGFNTQDRISRNYYNLFELVIIFRKANVEAYCIQERRWVTSDSPESILMTSVDGYRAQTELTTMHQRMYANKRYRMEQFGEACFGNTTPPFGLWLVKQPRSDGRLGTFLARKEDEVRVCHLIRDLLVEHNLSCTGIADRLTEMKVPSPAQFRDKSGHWSPGRVYRILTADTYFGEYRWGDITIPAPYEGDPIFSQEDRRRIQSVLQAHYRYTRYDRKADYLLTGLAKCSMCGYTYFGMSPKSGGKTYKYYACGGRMAPKRYRLEARCPSDYLRGNEFEGVIWEHTVNLIEQPTILREIMGQAEDVAQVDLSAELKEVDDMVDAIRRDQKGIILAIARGGLDRVDLANELLTEKEQELKAWLAHRQELLAQQDSITEWQEQVTFLSQEFEAWQYAIRADIPFEARREIVQALVDHIEIQGDEAHVWYNIIAPEVLTSTRLSTQPHHVLKLPGQVFTC